MKTIKTILSTSFLSIFLAMSMFNTTTYTQEFEEVVDGIQNVILKINKRKNLQTKVLS